MLAVLACALGSVSEAAVRQELPLADKVVRHPDLYIPTRLQPAAGLADDLGARIREDLAALGVDADSAFYDARAGRLTSLILREPLIPGTGAGNTLRWVDGAAGQALDEDRVREVAWAAVRGFIQERQARLRVDVAELGTPRVVLFEQATIVQVVAPRVIHGVPVRDSSATAVLNHGNLVLLGFDHWGDAPRVQAVASLGEAQAALRVAQHVSPLEIEALDKPRLEYIPMAAGEAYEYRLAWVVPAALVGDHGSWEGIVDAASGELLAFEDRNHYAGRTVRGGVFPVSNDGRPPDGIEQALWPMPFASVTTPNGPFVTTTGGTLSCAAAAGTATTALAGPFVRINDNCGAISESGPGNLDLGVSAGTDCVIPAGHSAGDTHSSRTGFYELNRIKEQARAHLPTNTWLTGQLVSNMNINLTCNAFWSTAQGTVNFYRDNNSACRNTGEIAAVFDHEWGHGMDANGTQAGISSPGEGIADIYAFLRLNDPCVGRGFFKNQVCSGYGDPCDGTIANGCTGIRNIDYLAHACDRPHTVTWITSGFTAAQCNGVARPACPGGGGTPCNRATHCEGKIVGETAFDLARRDLTAAPFNFDINTAHEVATRLWYILAQPVVAWYTCAAGGGCGATNGYMQALAADDDNGNLNDGTPHMTAIRAAFERHEIHCSTPAVVNGGCANVPTAVPVLTATAAAEGVNLSWTAVPNAVRYNVYRTEGVSACNFGKTKIAEVVAPATTFSDTGLLGGRLYSYIVIPTGSAATCFGRASACASATPVAGACVTLNPVALNVDAAGNQVLQPNEGAVGVAPSWQNASGVASAVTGTASNFTGPAGPGYVLTDAAANYGTINGGATAACVDCYAVSITAGPRPAQHWDSTLLETLAPSGTTKTWTLHVGDSFTDVPPTNAFYRFVETILHKNVTGGCTPTTYCPSASTTRDAMAVFVLVSKEPPGYTPPACGAPMFADVPPSSPFCRWVEELARRGVAAGCAPGLYCPTAPVTREQMAVFVLRTLDPALSPPACVAGSEQFADVPASSAFCRWIEELFRRGVVTGCGGGNYCPTAAVTREQMSVFLAVTFGLVLYGP
jgi:hypothetical protein